jgi:radical SAM-linked protein
MVGLPTETEEDISGIAELARSLCRIARRVQPSAQLSLSVSGFVPKPHTPFQWEKQFGIEELAEIQARLKKDLSRERLKLKMEDPRNSLLEGIFSRAGRELCAVIESAHNTGARFDGWTEQFNLDNWFKSFEENGIDYRDYMQERPVDFMFPFEHMDPCVSRTFLLGERELARSAKITDDCRTAGCVQDCGVCDQQIIAPHVAELFGERSSEELIRTLDQLPVQSELYFRYLVRYRRINDLRFMGLLENNRMFLRAVRRADLPMRYSQGFHPLPKISFSPAPPVGVESDAEFVELEIMDHLAADMLKSLLQDAMPAGIDITEVKEVSLKAPSISQLISLMEYVALVPEDLKQFITQEKIDAFNNGQTFIIEQKREKKERSIDLKQKVKFIEIYDEIKIKFGMIISGGPSAKPYEVVGKIFGLSEEDVSRIRFRRTEVRFREERPIEYPGTAVRSRPAEPYKRR